MVNFIQTDGPYLLNTQLYKLPKKSAMQCFRKFKVHVEVPFFLFGICMMYDTSITPNFLLFRTCNVILGQDQHNCSLLGTDHPDNYTQQLESEVQKYATKIIMTRSLCDAIIPPIVCLFLAPWSDRYGRKPLLLLGIIGLGLSYLVMGIVSALQQISPWYFVLLEIPLFVGGSNLLLSATCFSYIADTTGEENRGIRLGFLDAAINVGNLVGTLSSSYVFEAFGYPVIYGICTACQLCSTIFTFFFIKESLESRETKGKWRALFDVAPIKETIRITFKKRSNSDRALLLCCLSLLSLFAAGRFADSGMIYLYLRRSFKWTLDQYTLYLAIGTVTWAVFSSVSVIIVVKVLRLKETIAIIAATILCILNVFVQGFATLTWHIYAAIILKSMASYLGPMTQSLLTRVACKEEIGKIFGALMFLQTVCILLTSSLNTLIYQKTLLVFPQAFTLLTGGLYGLGLLVAIFVLILNNQRENKGNLNEEAKSS